MAFPRASGVLAHPTSFPGPHGIGDLGPEAFRFVDWLAQAGQRLWQLMPLGPTGFGDSPYASSSAFAGNPLLISLDWLVGDGLLEQSDLDGGPEFADHEVMFGSVIGFKLPLLRRAFERFRSGAAADQRGAFEQFCRDEAWWLDDYALFTTLKDQHGGQSWLDWGRDVRLRKPAALADVRTRLADDVQEQQFVQFQFRRQWATLKRYANERAVRIVGDIPIFVATDSADVWANPHLFRLDAEARPVVVTGVPPDAFSDTGQLWGNPAFAWDRMAEDGYAWWVARIRAMLATVDVIRIDHFRGFAAAWIVPAAAEIAADGRWEKGPGAAVFRAIENALGEVPIVIEDLGVITPDVVALRQELGYPGMKVLQFAFEGDPDNPYLPHNYAAASVVYTATHDNQTTVGWFHSRPEAERQEIQRYLGRDGSDIAWDMIRLALGSVADTAILPLQDVMRLGDDARMNTPGRPAGNWGWRYLSHQLHGGLAAGLNELTAAYGRRERPERERGHDPFDYTVEGTAHPLA